MPSNPPAPIVRQALQTLSDIQRYVDSKSFDLNGLARGLGIDQNTLRPELDWLVDQGYLEGRSCGSMSLSAKGKRYEEASENGGESFEIEFTKPSEPQQDVEPIDE